MKYFAARRSFLLESPAVDASCAAIGAWYRLQSYATSDDVESPVLAGARLWSARRWGSLQLRIADVNCAVKAGLAVWDGDDLRVDVGFDSEGFSMLLKSRRIAQQNGRLGGRPKVVEIIESTEPTSEPPLKPTANRLSSDLISSDLDLPLGIGSAEGKGKKSHGETPAFAAFYAVYPKHVDRAEAAEVWNAGKLDLKATEIMAGLNVQLAALKAREPKHVRSPARWLRRGNWKDDAGAYAIAPPGANGNARNGHTHDVRVGHTMADGQVHRGGGVLKDF